MRQRSTEDKFSNGQINASYFLKADFEQVPPAALLANVKLQT